VSGYVIYPVEYAVTAFNAATSSHFVAPCPIGSRPVGGGLETGMNGTGLTLTASHPTPGTTATATGWRVQLRNNTNATISTALRVYAVCVGVRP
jgi:hypothetical protein